jgi:DNA-binding transcriptional MocR family regulator
MAARTVGITGEMARYWIETDMATQILERCRTELAARRSLFLEMFKDTVFRCAPGSPHAWLRLPAHWQPTRFAQVLAQRNIKVTPGNLFELDGLTQSQHIRMCFGAPKNSWRLREAFDVIRTLMDDHEFDDFTPVA